MMDQRRRRLPAIGWREWVGLPDLQIARIKVKVDTGARSSSLHAFEVEEFERGEQTWVRFQVHTQQRNDMDVVTVESEILEYRSVRSSSGKATLRPVIVTHVSIMGRVWPVELTLADRSRMGFRMLLGREAIRHRFLVDSGRSYYGRRWRKKTQSSAPKT